MSLSIFRLGRRFVFFEFTLGFDEVLVGGGEVGAACGGPYDGAAYCYAGESDGG